MGLLVTTRNDKTHLNSFQLNWNKRPSLINASYLLNAPPRLLKFNRRPMRLLDHLRYTNKKAFLDLYPPKEAVSFIAKKAELYENHSIQVTNSLQMSPWVNFMIIITIMSCLECPCFPWLHAIIIIKTPKVPIFINPLLWAHKRTAKTLHTILWIFVQNILFSIGHAEFQ